MPDRDSVHIFWKFGDWPGEVDVVIVSMGVIIREYEESEEMFEGGTVGNASF